MTSPHTYTRSLLRRFFAYVIDGALAGIMTTLVIVLLGLVAGDHFRLSSGVFNFTYCEDTQEVYGPGGEQLSMSGFTRVQICTVTADFLSKDRKAVFIRDTTVQQDGNTSAFTTEFYDSLAFPVDAQNRAVRPVYIDPVFWVILILGAASFESSRFQATPGKQLLGLAVRSDNSGRVSLKASLIRNALKNSWSLYGLFGFYVGLAMQDYDTVFQDGKVIVPPDLWAQLQVSLFVGLGIFVFMIAIIFGLFLPWSKAGRALYDKLADTYVIRIR